MANDAVNTILGLCITFPILAIITVTARFYARRLRQTPLAADDWCILVALICCVGNGILGLIGVYHGDLGVRQPLGPKGFALPSPKLVVFKKVNYASTPVFITAITFAKFSVLLFYRRVFSVSTFRIPFIVVFALNLIYGFGFFWVYLLQCIPISQIWQTQVGETRTCVNTIINYPFAYADAALDFITIVLPIPYIVNMQMPLRRKFAVMGVFLLGSIVLATSIAKAVAFANILNVLTKDHDTTYDEAPIFYWTIPESCIAVIAACLPTIRPIFKGWSPESIVGSIRSIITLGSLDSQGRSRATRAGYSRDINRSESATHFTQPSADREQKTAIGLDSMPSHANDGEIHVQKAFESRVEHR